MMIKIRIKNTKTGEVLELDGNPKDYTINGFWENYVLDEFSSVEGVCPEDIETIKKASLVTKSLVIDVFETMKQIKPLCFIIVVLLLLILVL